MLRALRSDISGDGELDEVERHIASYDVDGSGTFDVAEVKAIVKDLEQSQEEVGRMKWIIMGIILLSICGFAAMFGVTVAANEVSKDSRPNDSGAMIDNNDNLVQTGTEQADGERWGTAVTDLGGALSSPDAQPVYTLDTLTDEELGRISSLTVDISPNTDGSHLRVYRVQAIEIERPAPGASGAANPPIVTVYTVKGDTMVITNSVATISTAAGETLSLSAADAAGRRRRRRRRRMQEVGIATWDIPVAPFEQEMPVRRLAEEDMTASGSAFNDRLQYKLAKHPLSWNDVTATARRSLHDQDAEDKALVRRRASGTSFIFELQQKGRATDFDSHHHGIGEGSILPLPLCTDAGNLHDFKLTQGGVLPDNLAEKFPMLKHYHAEEIDGSATADVTISASGVRAQIWVGPEERCYVDPHTVGRADKYTVYSSRDLPEGDAAADLDAPEDIQIRLDQLHRDHLETGPTADTDSTNSRRRRMADKSDLIYPPPPGPTMVRTYETCFALSPDYIAFAYEHFPNDGPMGLLLTTVARASGVWRRSVGISLALCKKQDQLMHPETCDMGVVSGNAGCGVDECFCEPMEVPWEEVLAGDTCSWKEDGMCDSPPENTYCPPGTDLVDCGLADRNGTQLIEMTPAPAQCTPIAHCKHHNFGGTAIGGKCYEDAAGDINAGRLPCNTLENDATGQFLDVGYAWMERMGVTTDDYDLAHYLGGSGGGGLGRCCACDTGARASHKAGGGTSMDYPMGDSFVIDFVAHELGHQFGHGHTFAGADGGCAPSNFLPNEAVEIGGGRTILSYAGICGADNTDDVSDHYFASVSLGFFSKGQNDPNWAPNAWSPPGVLSSCGIVEETANTRPTVEVMASCEIPLGTPYELYGTATDPDVRDILTYNWEQVDAAVTQTSLSQENTGVPGVAGSGGPLVISVPPSEGGNLRSIPDLETAMRFRGEHAVKDPFERMSSIARDLHFSLTVRDGYSQSGSGCRGVAGCTDNELDSPGGERSVGSWDSKVTTVHVSTAGPLVWDFPAENVPAPDLAAFTCEDDDSEFVIHWGAVGVEFPEFSSWCEAIAEWDADWGACYELPYWGFTTPQCECTCAHAADGTGGGRRLQGGGSTGGSGDFCEEMAHSKYGHRWPEQAHAVRNACEKARAPQTELETGPQEIGFSLIGAAPGSPLTNGTVYQLEAKLAYSAEALLNGEDIHEELFGGNMGGSPGWVPVPGADRMTMMGNGHAFHEIFVPEELAGLYAVMRVVTHTPGEVTAQAGCRAFALSPTFRIVARPAPNPIDLVSQWPEPAQVDVPPMDGFVMFMFDAPVYMAEDAPSQAVEILVDGTPSRTNYWLDHSHDHVMIYSEDGFPPASTIEVTLSPELLVSAPGHFDYVTDPANAGEGFSLTFTTAAASDPVPTTPPAVVSLHDTQDHGVTLTAEFDMPVHAGHNRTLQVLARGMDATPMDEGCDEYDPMGDTECNFVAGTETCEVAAVNGVFGTGFCAYKPRGWNVCEVPLDEMDGASLDGSTGTIHGLAYVCELWPGNWYDVVIPGDVVVSAEGGVPLVDDIVWTFKTDPETVPPTIWESIPYPDSHDVPEQEAVVAFFDEPVRVNEACTPPLDDQVCFVEITSSKPGEYTMHLPLISGETDGLLSDTGDEADASIHIHYDHMFMPPPRFSELTMGWSSSTTYNITLPRNAVTDLAGNGFEGGTLVFTTGDTHAPTIEPMFFEQMDGMGGPIIVGFMYDDPDAVLSHGSGEFLLVDTDTGYTVSHVTPDSDEGFYMVDLSMPGMMMVVFNGSMVPPDAPLAVRWTAGALAECNPYCSGISGYPRMFTPDGSEEDDPNKFNFTSASAPPPPPPPRTSREYGNCWDFVREEQYLTQFEHVATEDPMTLDWAIDINGTASGYNSTAAHLQDVLLPERYSIPEIEVMLYSQDMDGDGLITSEEYVRYRCPCEPEICTEECPEECPYGTFEPPPPMCEPPIYGKYECDNECSGMAFVEEHGLCTSCEADGMSPITEGSMYFDSPAIMCPLAPGCGGEPPLDGKTACDPECEGLVFVAEVGICTACEADGETYIYPDHAQYLNPPAVFCEETFSCDPLPELCEAALVNVTGGADCCGCEDGPDELCSESCYAVPPACHEVLSCPGVCDGVVEAHANATMEYIFDFLHFACPDEFFACVNSTVCMDEFEVALQADHPPTAGSAELMEMVGCALAAGIDEDDGDDDGEHCTEAVYLYSFDPANPVEEELVCSTGCYNQVMQYTDNHEESCDMCIDWGHVCNCMCPERYNTANITEYEDDYDDDEIEHIMHYLETHCPLETLACFNSTECTGEVMDAIHSDEEPTVTSGSLFGDLVECVEANDHFPCEPEQMPEECLAPLDVVGWGAACCGCENGDGPCDVACYDVPGYCHAAIECPGICVAPEAEPAEDGCPDYWAADNMCDVPMYCASGDYEDCGNPDDMYPCDDPLGVVGLDMTCSNYLGAVNGGADCCGCGDGDGPCDDACWYVPIACQNVVRDCAVCDPAPEPEPEVFDCESPPAVCEDHLVALNGGTDCCGCYDGVEPCAPGCEDVPSECHEILWCDGICDGVVELYEAYFYLSEMCPEELAVCEAHDGGRRLQTDDVAYTCMDELIHHVANDEPPTAGSDELMALAECVESVDGFDDAPYDSCAEMHPNWVGDGECDVPSDSCEQGDFEDCGYPDDMYPNYEPPVDNPDDSCHYQNDMWCDAADLSSEPYCEANSDVNDCGLCFDDNGDLACGALFCNGCDYEDPWDASMLPGWPSVGYHGATAGTSGNTGGNTGGTDDAAIGR